MAERTIRVSLVGDATSLIAAATEARTALNRLATTNIGNVRAGMQGAGAAAAAATGQMNSWSAALKTGLAVAGVQVGLMGIAMGFKAVIGQGMEYRANMNTLQAVTRASTTTMAEMTAKAKQLGNDLSLPGASAASAAEAMKELAKGGLTAKQAMDAAHDTLALATAAQVSGAVAATIQARALQAFGLQANDASKVADYLANSANAATGEVTDMAWALQQAATVARGMGISMLDTTTTLALFAKNGVVGSDAGTSLKTMLAQLASPTKNQAAALKMLNVDMFDAQGHFKGMESMAAQLSAAHQKLTTEQYNQAASTAFGTDALRAANIMGAEGVAGFTAMQSATAKAGGAAELAAAQTQGLTGTWNALVNTVSTVSSDLFEKLEPALMVVGATMNFVVSATGFLGTAFGKLPAPIQGLLLGLTAMILLKGPLNALLLQMGYGLIGLSYKLQAMKASVISAGTTFVGVLAAMKLGWTAFWKSVGAAMATNPLGWLILGLSVLIPLVSSFFDKTEDAGAAVTDWTDVVNTATGAILANAAANAAGKDAVKAIVKEYTDWGGASGDISLALTGNQDAMARVNALYLEHAKSVLDANGSYELLGMTVDGVKESEDAFAARFLAGQQVIGGGGREIEQAYQQYQDFQTQLKSIADAQTAGAAVGKESAGAMASGGSAAEKAAVAATQVTEATKGILEAYNKTTPAAYLFKSTIDADSAAMAAAADAAKYLSLVLPGAAMRRTMTAYRENQAALRGVAAASRDYAAAAEGVKDAEKNLEETRSGTPAELKAIENAQKSVGKATESADDAEKSLAKTQKTNAETIANAEGSLAKARTDSAKANIDAEKELRTARADAAKANADAAKELSQARKDAADKIVETEKKVLSTQKDALKELRKAQEKLAEVQIQAAEDMAKAQKKYTDALKEGQKGQIDLRIAQEDAAKARAKAADETIGAGGSAQTVAFNTFAAAQDKLTAMQKSGTATAYELAKAQDAVRLALKDPNLSKDLVSAMDDLDKAEKNNQDNSKKTIEARKELKDTRKSTTGRVADAKTTLADTTVKGQEDVAAAKKDYQDAVAAGAEKIQAAQEKVAEAAASGAKAVADANAKIAETSAAGAKSVQDAQKSVKDAYESTAESLLSAQRAVRDANQGMVDAQTAVTDAQKAATPTTDELAAAERALAAARDAVADAGDKQAAANDKAGESARLAAAQAFADKVAQGDLAGGVEAATNVMGVQRQAFINMQIEAGKSATEAGLLADAQGLIPKDVSTHYNNLDAEGAKKLADDLNKSIENIDNKNVRWEAHGTSVVQVDLDAEAAQQAMDKVNRELKKKGLRAIYASGGYVSGPGGPTDDKIDASLSNGEFVVNAAQTTKYRSLLESINDGREGFAAGGLVGKAGKGKAMSPLVATSTIPVPDLDGVSKVWGDMGDKVDGTVKKTITPAIDLLDESLMSNGKGHQKLLDDKVGPVWANIGKTVSDAQGKVLTPRMNDINLGSAGVGNSMSTLLSAKVTPSWDGIGKKVSDTWGTTIKTNYGSMNTGTSGVASNLATAKTHMDTSWSGIGGTIKTSYDSHIKPAHDHITDHTKSVKGLFDGIDTGSKKSAGNTKTNLGTINTEVDAFFKSLNKLSPETPAPSAPAPSAPSSPAPSAPAPRGPRGGSRAVADGGYIHEGTGPRTDDVHLMASRGEYVVNAKSTAKHRATLDHINYAGKYADGGLVTTAARRQDTARAGKYSAKRVEDSTLGRAERAIEAGVDSFVARFSAYGDGGSGNYPAATGARGKFLEAVMAQQGTHYVWGGAGPPPDFDCSGLMSWGLIQAGVGKGRLTAADFNHSFPHITVAKPGDMVTFDTGRIPGDAGHIGAVVDPSKGLMMHTDGAGPARISDYKSRDGGPLSIIDPIGGSYVPKAPATPKAGGKAGDPPSAGWLGKIIAKIKAIPKISDTPFAGLQPDQSLNARSIAAVAVGRGLGRNGVVIGEDVAFTESTLHNVAHGDAMGPSSTGLFQQMPPWGSYATRMDPKGSAGLFFDALLRLDPSWTSRSIPMAAQAVQQSEFADGRNYASNLSIANQITAGLGYDKGGKLPVGPSSVYNGLSSPESVLTDRQWSLANSAMNYVINAATSAAAPVITLNARVFVGGKELMDDVRIEVDNSYSQLRTEINLQQRQEL